MNKLFGGLMAKAGKWLKPLWKGAAKRVLKSQFESLRARVKANIDSDEDASIVRINKLFDGAQKVIIEDMEMIPLLPAGLRAEAQSKVQIEGDKIQANLIVLLKRGGPGLVDKAFDGLESRLDEIIEGL